MLIFRTEKKIQILGCDRLGGDCANESEICGEPSDGRRRLPRGSRRNVKAENAGFAVLFCLYVEFRVLMSAAINFHAGIYFL